MGSVTLTPPPHHHHHTTTNSLTMLKLIVLALTLAMVSAETRRFAPLSPLSPSSHSGCSTAEMFACGTEISTAFNDCFSSLDILGCMEEIIGASDCWVCACDVLEWLGLMTCE